MNIKVKQTKTRFIKIPIRLGHMGTALNDLQQAIINYSKISLKAEQKFWDEAGKLMDGVHNEPEHSHDLDVEDIEFLVETGRWELIPDNIKAQWASRGWDG